MAMFKCPDCKNKISSSASACPKCGRPVTDEDRKSLEKKKDSIWKAFGIPLAIFLLIWYFSSGRNEPNVINTTSKGTQVESHASVSSNKISKDKLTQKLRRDMRQITATLNEKYGRTGGGYDISWHQFGAEGGTTYAIEVQFNKSLQKEMIQFASQAIALAVLKGMEEQGVSENQIKKRKTMIIASATCKRTGKKVSYGAAIIYPAESDEVQWIDQYLVQ